MTESFENLLYLFGAAATGKNIALNKEINVEEIRKYAIQQGIWSTVYSKLQDLCDVSAYKKEVLSVITSAAARTEYTSYILKKLDEKGIECCLVKGISISRLYHEPEFRISSDTDILIDPKDENKVAEVLKENGYIVEERSSNDHHMRAFHSVGGLLEAHIMLYSEITSQFVFNGMNMYGEPYKEFEFNGYCYKTLGVNDGLFYLTAHYIKHLVNSGGGVRQMMDLLLYIDYYKNEIDFNKYYEVLKELRYEKLIKIVMSIGAKYFGFNYEITDEQLMQKILDDTEKGGIFGFSALERKGFYSEYCSKRSNWSKLKYTAYTALKSEISPLKNIFPPREKMEQMGYKDKLLIVSWIKRMYGFVMKRVTPVATNRKNGIDARMDLMKELDMID